MFLHIVNVEYVDDYRLTLQFSDGRTGIANLAESLHGGVFEALRDPSLFRQVKLDQELGTVQWPNGVDFAPEFLYFLALRNEQDLQEQFQQWGYVTPAFETEDLVSAYYASPGRLTECADPQTSATNPPINYPKST
jgi:hypothetical protein